MPAALELIPIGVYFLMVVLIGLAYAYRYTFGAFLYQLSEALGSVSIPTGFFGSVHPLRWASSVLDDFNNGIYAAIGAGIDACSWAYTQWTHFEAYAWQELGSAVRELAEGTDQALGYLVRHKIAAMIAAVFGPLAATVYALRKQVAALVAEGVHVIEQAPKVITNETTKVETKVVRITKTIVEATAGAVAGELPALRRRVREAENEATEAFKTAERLAQRVGAGAIVGTVAAAIFARLGLGWLKCSNVERAGKQLCGLDRGLLESLLVGTVAVFGTVSLVDFAKEVQTGTEDAAKIVGKFYRVV